MTPVRLEPAALRSRVKHSTTEPLRSLFTLYTEYQITTVIALVQVEFPEHALFEHFEFFILALSKQYVE